MTKGPSAPVVCEKGPVHSPLIVHSAFCCGAVKRAMHLFKQAFNAAPTPNSSRATLIVWAAVAMPSSLCTSSPTFNVTLLLRCPTDC